jgi:hypothetical protein
LLDWPSVFQFYRQVLYNKPESEPGAKGYALFGVIERRWYTKRFSPAFVFQGFPVSIHPCDGLDSRKFRMPKAVFSLLFLASLVSCPIFWDSSSVFGSAAIRRIDPKAQNKKNRQPPVDEF